MIIFLEGGVVVGREHLAVRVDVHAGSLGLDEQLFEVLQVVAADENGGVAPHSDVYFAYLRMAVGGGVGLVQQGHGLDRRLAGFEHQGDHLVNREVLGGRSQSLHDEIADLVTGEPQDGGVLGVGRDPLQPEDQQVLQRADVLVFRGQNSHGCGLFREGGRIVRVPGGRVVQRLVEAAAVLFLVCFHEPGLELFAPREGLLDGSHEALVVPVGVGDGHEKPLDDEEVVAVVRSAQLLEHLAVDGDPFKHVDQEVLEVGCLLGFAAYALDGAAGIPNGLLALVTEHRHSPFLFS